MKKMLAVVTALVVALCLAVPAMAISGVDAPAKPAAPEELAAGTFDAKLTLVNNTPKVEEDDDFNEYNVWEPIDGKTQFKVGDKITYILSYAIPAELEQFTQEEAASILFELTAKGLKNILIFEATGCDPNTHCDYDLGICQILPGYGNVTEEGNVCKVKGRPNTEVSIVFTAEIADAKASLNLVTTVGQYKIPATFSVGTLGFVKDYATIDGTAYSAYQLSYENKLEVYKDGISFLVTGENTACEHIIVTTNTSEFVVAAPEFYDGIAQFGFAPVKDGVISFDKIITQGKEFDAIMAAYEKYMTFFNFSLEKGGVLAEGVFLAGHTSHQNELNMNLNVAGGAQPTPGPVPPATGAGSVALMGAAFICAGGALGVKAWRRRK